MHLYLAAISDLPKLALFFVLNNAAAIATGVWGAGFAFLIVRAMMRWYKEDAADARLAHPNGSEDVVWKAMHGIKATKKGERMKYIFIQCLFWLPLMMYQAGRSMAKAIFYPVLVVLDKAKTEAFQGAMTNTPVARSGGHADALLGRQDHRVVLTGSIECSLCRNLVPVESMHRCSAAEVRCKRCSGRVIPDTVHSCGEALDSPVGNQRAVMCEDCGNEIIPDSVHSCEGRTGNELFCKPCEVKYDPDDDDHGVDDCDSCERRHCPNAGCSA